LEFEALDFWNFFRFDVWYSEFLFIGDTLIVNPRQYPGEGISPKINNGTYKSL
jgi:hypothetical protein